VTRTPPACTRSTHRRRQPGRGGRPARGIRCARDVQTHGRTGKPRAHSAACKCRVTAVANGGLLPTAQRPARRLHDGFAPTSTAPPSHPTCAPREHCFWVAGRWRARTATLTLGSHSTRNRTAVLRSPSPRPHRPWTSSRARRWASKGSRRSVLWRQLWPWKAARCFLGCRAVASAGSGGSPLVSIPPGVEHGGVGRRVSSPRLAASRSPYPRFARSAPERGEGTRRWPGGWLCAQSRCGAVIRPVARHHDRPPAARHAAPAAPAFLHPCTLVGARYVVDAVVASDPSRLRRDYPPGSPRLVPAAAPPPAASDRPGLLARCSGRSRPGLPPARHRER